MIQKNRNNVACTVCTWEEAVVEIPEGSDGPEGSDNSEELASVGD